MVVHALETLAWFIPMPMQAWNYSWYLGFASEKLELEKFQDTGL